MDTRIFAKTGEPISLLGYGMMRLPTVGKDVAKIDYAAAQALVDRAIEAGINYFDTAYGYHEGSSEVFVGQALSRYPRESFHVATKMPPWYIKSEEDVHTIFETQLKRLQVDYVDFYLLHNVTVQHWETFEKFHVLEFLKEKQKEGKLRHLGFSFHDRPELLRKIVQKHSWDFAQIQLNYLDWEDQNAKEQYEILAEHGIPVIIMEPVRGGALANLPEECVKVLREANPNASTASWAIRFAAQLPGVLTVLSGMTTKEQLEDNIATLSPLVPLSQQEQQAIDKAVEIFRRNGAIPCTACRYCMDCPFGVDIPKVFALYNHYQHSKNAISFEGGYEMLAETGPESCTGCQTCVDKCPQNIAIPDMMQKVVQAYKELPSQE
ncbi:MAG TPA: aldo/keto reductase [Clostridiales bacterium]|nr:aldo/keto reductase [Clostridiales bacterium]